MYFWCYRNKVLLEDAGDETGGDGTATLTDVEALTLLNGEGLVDLADHLDVVTGHDHLGVGVLGSLGPVESGGLVCGVSAKRAGRDAGAGMWTGTGLSVKTYQQYG